MLLQQGLAGSMALVQCLQQCLGARVQMLAGGQQCLLLAFDQRGIQCLLLFGGGAPGVGIAAGIGLQALADACAGAGRSPAPAVPGSARSPPWPSWLRWQRGCARNRR
ncbi:hypothetical protein G6F68_018443 [Rhizopus microsporus]|nr:hypothetical protein G6F68_018443 [Rhizopus microsporus]